MYQNGMALGMALENDWHGFLGSFTADKAGEFFNLVYEKITDPELRYDDFDEIKQSMIEDLDNDDESVLEKMLNRAPDRQLMARMDRSLCATCSPPTTHTQESTMSKPPDSATCRASTSTA